jgi:hypothetical protein
MKRLLTTLLSIFIVLLSFGQTRFVITNVTLSEKGEVLRGVDAVAQMKSAEGSDEVVIFHDDRFTVLTKVKVKTYNVKRSSVKSGAVYVTFEVDLTTAGKKDNRRVEKVFYAGDERSAHIKESFTIKEGIDVRTIVLEYDGRIE